MLRTKRALAMVALTVLTGCGNPTLPASTPTLAIITLHLPATTATITLANDLAVNYRRLNPSIRLETEAGNFQSGVNGLNRGETSYFLSNHVPADSSLWAAPIGQDGLVIITHPDNPVTGLTIAQLRAIYQGQLTNWKAVGGQDTEMVVFSREAGSGTRAEFENLVIGTRYTTQAARVAPSSKAMLTSIQQTPASIGYVSISYLNSSVQPLAIDGIQPTLENVINNTYPLRTTLFVVGLQEPETHYRALIGWIQSPQGQTIVARHHAPLLLPR
jgi:phosphate transport system substrate-binding protein